MKKSKSPVAISAALLYTAPSALVSAQESQPAIVQQGKFTLHKFEQAIGEETYEIRRDGDSLATKIDFKFTDRGSEVPLSTTFRAMPALTPQSFEIKGRTARTISIDQSVSIKDGAISQRSRDTGNPNIPVPTGSFFTISGYAPVTMQMLMVRYWALHGSPSVLAILPGTRLVKIEPRGHDAIHVGDKTERLDRYTVEGLIWGRETLWFDSSRNLIAAIATDAEFDHFEAIRTG